MKITIDKNYTVYGALRPLKEYGKEFKKRYTEGDLMSVVDTYGEVLKCDVELWTPINPIFGLDDTDVNARVVLWLSSSWDTVKKIVYYCDGKLTLSENFDVEYTQFKKV